MDGDVVRASVEQSVEAEGMGQGCRPRGVWFRRRSDRGQLNRLCFRSKQCA